MLIARGGELYTPWCMIRTTVFETTESKQKLWSRLLKAEKPKHIGVKLEVYRGDFLFHSPQNNCNIAPGEGMNCNQYFNK